MNSEIQIHPESDKVLSQALQIKIKAIQDKQRRYAEDLVNEVKNE